MQPETNSQGVPAWIRVVLTDGESFIAQNFKEDVHTVVVRDVYIANVTVTGDFALFKVTSMRFIARGIIKYRDVIDELVDVNAVYEDYNDLPWYLQSANQG